jgi:pyruvate dehydrogenase (quinone)
MSRKVADLLWEMLAKAGVKRCYGIVGDALNPVIDGLRRNGKIEFVHVRHEEYGVFAAVAEACLLTAARPKNPIILWSTLKIHE